MSKQCPLFYECHMQGLTCSREPVVEDVSLFLGCPHDGWTGPVKPADDAANSSSMADIDRTGQALSFQDRIWGYWKRLLQLSLSGQDSS